MRPSQKQGDDGEGSSSNSRPRNIGRICLDGTEGAQALPSYIGGIRSVLDWLRDAETPVDVSALFGPNTEIIRTRRDGTFHMMIDYDRRALEILMAGRNLYIMGWRGPNGSYEITSDSQDENYMIGPVMTVDAGWNYRDLAPGGNVRNTRLGIHAFRRAFDDLYTYKGGSPGQVQEALGIIAVLLSEATRLWCVYNAVCASFTDDSISRLHKMSDDPLWVNRWKHYSGEGMEQVDFLLSRKEPPKIKNRGIDVKSAEDIFQRIRVFHRDAYNKGIFEHEDKPDKPVFEVAVDASEKLDDSNNRNKAKQGGKTSKRHDQVVTRGKESSASVMDHVHSRRPYCSSSDPTLVKDPSFLGGGLAQNFLSLPPWGNSISNKLKRWEAKVSDCFIHGPALRSLCRSNYDRKDMCRRPWSFRSSFDRIFNEQKWKKPRSTQSSADRIASEQKSPRIDSLHLSVRKAIPTIRTVRSNLDMHETDLKPMHKHCLQPSIWRRAGSLISKFLRYSR